MPASSVPRVAFASFCVVCKFRKLSLTVVVGISALLVDRCFINLIFFFLAASPRRYLNCRLSKNGAKNDGVKTDGVNNDGGKIVGIKGNNTGRLNGAVICGAFVGTLVGSFVTLKMGELVGIFVGTLLGDWDGITIGCFDGICVGRTEG